MELTHFWLKTLPYVRRRSPSQTFLYIYGPGRVVHSSALDPEPTALLPRHDQDSRLQGYFQFPNK